MKRSLLSLLVLLLAAPVQAQQEQSRDVPEIPYESVPNFLTYSPDMNLGEVLGVAVNSKGHLMVLNHLGSATSGPLYGNATTQLLEFDESGAARLHITILFSGEAQWRGSDGASPSPIHVRHVPSILSHALSPEQTT